MLNEQTRAKVASNRYIGAVEILLVVTVIVLSGVIFQSSSFQKEKNMAIYILGKEGKIGDYYPYGDNRIVKGVQVEWTIGILNKLEKPQLVEIRAKISNSTIASPDELLPTEAPVIYTFESLVPEGGKVEFPFIWRIVEIIQRSDSINIVLNVNDINVNSTSVTAPRGKNFRIVFELWTFDEVRQEFIYGWSEGNGGVAWTQMWFNVAY